MPSNYYELYFPILCQAIFAAVVAVGLVGGGLLLGKRVRNSAKDTPYESGMQPVGSARERFSVKFFLVAMVFILFDIEAIFLYPWAVVYRELAQQSRLFPFIEMLLFIVLVLAGFFYIWKKGVLDWSHEAMKAFREDGRETAPVKTRMAGLGYTLTEEKPAQLIEK
jgi:NADH-quinone oxidoreductase subunit A